MDAAQALEARIRTAIPMSQSMRFHIDSLDSASIEVSAPLEPNINIHGTGFAGSIYSVAVLSGWALCTHILESFGVDAELVVSKAEIRYRAPVSGELRCFVRAGDSARDAFLAGVREQGKGMLELDIEVGDLPSARLRASYCALAGK